MRIPQKTGILLTVLLLVLFITACNSRNEKRPIATNASFNARSWNFSTNGSINLDGEWQFTNASSATSLLQVPGIWPDSTHYGEYRLEIQLPKKTPTLGMKVIGISTSYALLINDSIIGTVGLVGKSPLEISPEYENRVYPIKSTDSLLRITLLVSNIDHYKGGILQSIVLGDYQILSKKSKNDSLIGGILIGICIINAVVYMMLYLFMRDKKYFFYYALYSFIIVVHMLCLVDRILFQWLGWTAAYKIELATLFMGMSVQFLFYNSFFKNILNRIQLNVLCSILIIQGMLVILAPAPWFTYADLIVPYNFLIALLCMLVVFAKAIKLQLEGSTTISIFTLFILIVFANESFVLKKHVHDVQFIHIAVILYVTAVSVVLVRKIIEVFYSEKSLANDLIAAKEKLEKQNKDLEETVNRRTAQLLEVEKQSHQLQLEKKERDMDTLAASNLMKLQFTRNLIEELELLPKQEKELKPALNTLISKLRNQATIEEKLDVLQDLNRINTEFYERLGGRFPELSKTERELCAYIKLNLTNKEIAELRKTSLNTINVTRSRLRKKLGLTRDEELESFILQF